MTKLTAEDVQTGCFDPGDSFMSLRTPEDEMPMLKDWYGWWLVVLEHVDDFNLLYCVPIWEAEQWPEENVEHSHWPDPNGQTHLNYSIKHGTWWYREDIIGKERDSFHPEAATGISQILADMVEGCKQS